MASQRPQRNRRPPVFYGQEQEEDTFLQFQPPSPPKKPIDTRPPFDPDLVEECAFPSLNPVTHVGPGPSEVYKLRRQVREQQELKQMVEYEPWYHERIAKLSLRKRVVGRRDIGPFPGDVVEKASKGDKASRARSRGVSVEQVTYADTREDRLRWEKSREQELVWAVGSSSEGEEEEQEEEEEEEDNIQQRDMDVKTFRLLLTARNVNHRKQKEAVAAVEKARSHALSLATSQGRVNLVLPPASTLATAAGENQRDHDGDAVMGGGSLSQSTRQLVESLPKARWQFTIERWPKSPRRPTAAEKGKGKEVLPGEVSTIQSTMGPRRMSEGITRCFDGIDPLGVESPTVQPSMYRRIPSRR
ncbi:hypothetical protein QBC32DRAFT_371064 [Pseudoneurospora amorphoporcata]|uniref:Uncharacterized protein n=1 Tax=Pseudoneurospora amorphoporcata TaxID=241081 RepID=A0AAN6NTG1_9PEZI|nr:hypothetical protein QBC32DRAFT_371064 [Pseudoneurospora amorphoporcata]